MLRVVEALKHMYDILYAAGMFLSHDELTDFHETLDRLGRHYGKLASDALHVENKPRWKNVPNIHYVLAHLSTQAALINPLYVQGYCSESMIGAMSKIYGFSMAGPAHPQIQEKCLLKYRVGLLMLLKDMD